MQLPNSSPLTRLRNRILPVLMGPPILAFLPALTLGAFWLWGEAALVITSLGLPLLFAFIGAFDDRARQPSIPRDAVTGLMLREGFETALERTYADTQRSGMRSACFVLDLDDYKDLTERHGIAAADLVAQQTGERICAALRNDDVVARIGDSRFAVCLSPVRVLDLELCIQLAGRMQAAVEDPISLDASTVYMTASVGLCMRRRAPGQDAAAWLQAATEALAEAQRSGPSGIRVYSADTHRRSQARNDLREEAAFALENGQIQPWYQPQISTDTGKITGFEALARWVHPVHGVLTPDNFLPALEQAGLLERLGQVILYHALTAIKAWDSAGVDVPSVGVNFATEELRNPGLVDRIRWELDRFDLTADRLSVEILESVVSTDPDDTIAHNIAGLAKLGCGIDLDDFGTGHASFSSIRRFAVSRIKIDRSFVMKSDRDPEQQRMIAAILTMAERLELETLAEGVETVGEHALLAQLGCDHVQGFGIGRPMPFEQTLDWIATHHAKLRDAPRIGRETG
ncbi:putative bifunctional diguanylate cyclase/phosphodiesterase [Pseudodonghicola flavimaris]|uniref:Bifunctional diguanylate cyclase/phosphodiesterase n=1 Tax=Pseudodonghicola flavimaris TaxID=3050036 RepID=A0ABT7F282_9RHOB|nr:bifunctional diguanylate cyclase/phosphodiesterase [Pseudodonghicola flavimaris]MDK3018713.1 bifunctional diguanylate cyclase/phosphodiesterase [Pseudodonghicola flavimaris]